MGRTTARTLLVISPLVAVVTRQNRVVLTAKFIAGMSAYASLWDGPVCAVVEPASAPTDDLDHVEVDPHDLPFQLEVMNVDRPELMGILRDAAVVFAFAWHRHNHIYRLCQTAGVPCVYLTEYSLRTRLQIIRCERQRWTIRLRRSLWEIAQERARRRSIRAADGLQCNGTPTWTAYRRLNPHPLLFFDSRSTQATLPTNERLEARLAGMRQGRPLRLVFAGRLIEMKGVDHLPRLAAALRDLSVPFEMSICGDGRLKGKLAADLHRLELQRDVRLRGTLDFDSSLVPLMRDQCDLFVSCHRQGDPSSSYLEAFACGLPIAGYGNEALTGVLNCSRGGWVVPVDDVQALACRLRDVHIDRSLIANTSAAALEFARQHTMERTFERRIAHLRSVSQGATDGPYRLP